MIKTITSPQGERNSALFRDRMDAAVKSEKAASLIFYHLGAAEENNAVYGIIVNESLLASAAMLWRLCDAMANSRQVPDHQLDDIKFIMAASAVALEKYTGSESGDDNGDTAKKLRNMIPTIGKRGYLSLLHREPARYNRIVQLEDIKAHMDKEREDLAVNGFLLYYPDSIGKLMAYDSQAMAKSMAMEFMDAADVTADALYKLSFKDEDKMLKGSDIAIAKDIRLFGRRDSGP